VQTGPHFLHNKQSKQGDNTMSWKAPKIVEIALGAEINSYACAEAKK
jgi:coenzyme PQQ precursor peptide PqqA